MSCDFVDRFLDPRYKKLDTKNKHHFKMRRQKLLKLDTRTNADLTSRVVLSEERKRRRHGSRAEFPSPS
jgi:hypothetical protein